MVPSVEVGWRAQLTFICFHIQPSIFGDNVIIESYTYIIHELLTSIFSKHHWRTVPMYICEHGIYIYMYMYMYIYIYIFDTYPPLISHQKLQKRVLLLLSPQFTAMTHQFSSPATIKVMSSIFIQWFFCCFFSAIFHMFRHPWEVSRCGPNAWRWCVREWRPAPRGAIFWCRYHGNLIWE